MTVPNNQTQANRRASAQAQNLNVSKQEHRPYVRYMVPTDEGVRQERLVPLTTNPPDEALWVSPGVWWLTKAEERRLHNYARSKNIQAQINQSGRSFFRVVAESDRVGHEEPNVVSNWLIEFARDWLGLRREDFDLYYSGNRSIHLEADKWLRFNDWIGMGAFVKEFNDETGAQLDANIYKPKPQFRLAGATHRDTGMSKVRIRENDSKGEIFRLARKDTQLSLPVVHYSAGNGSTSSVLSEIEKGLIEPLIKEDSVQASDSPLEHVAPFSPYANTGDGRRSLCIMTVFSILEHDERQYAKGIVWEALGADGQYKRFNSACDVLLSPQDASKVEPGTDVAIIGSQSRKSMVIEIDRDERMVLKEELQSEGFDSAIELLDRWGNDTGKPGLHPGNYSRGGGMSKEVRELKQDMEARRARWSYDNTVRVSASILRTQGFREADRWIETHSTFQYDPEDTHERLTAIAKGLNRKDDGHPDIQIP